MQLLRGLADTYMGPGSGFPPEDMPAGYTIKISIQRVAGVDPWAALQKNVRALDK